MRIRELPWASQLRLRSSLQAVTCAVCCLLRIPAAGPVLHLLHRHGIQWVHGQSSPRWNNVEEAEHAAPSDHCWKHPDHADHADTQRIVGMGGTCAGFSAAQAICIDIASAPSDYILLQIHSRSAQWWRSRTAAAPQDSAHADDTLVAVVTMPSAPGTKPPPRTKQAQRHQHDAALLAGKPRQPATSCRRNG